MDKIILKNITMNLVFTIAFVILNNWVLQNNFEETFIFLALSYGVVNIIANGFFIKLFLDKNKKVNLKLRR